METHRTESRDSEGDWNWVTGETWDYTNWYPGEPNNSGGLEHGLNFHPGETWNDTQISGGYLLGYVVEFEASPVPVPAAAWLFGSGLLFLFGRGYKRRA